MYYSQQLDSRGCHKQELHHTLGRESVFLINTMDHNIWIRQPVLAAEVYELELHPWQFCTVLNQEGIKLRLDSS